MKLIFSTIIIVLLINISYGQTLKSGIYYPELKLALDNNTKKLTGYYESYTGWDEEYKNPRFSCIFYIEGFVDKDKIKVLTYYPENKSEDSISGQIEIINNGKINIKLPEEHGGCWNVQHFSDEPVSFDIEKETEWVQIKYVIVNKTYFYSEKLDTKKQKAYLVKNDFVCIEKIEDEWAFCSFYGKRITKGWIKTVDLNK